MTNDLEKARQIMGIQKYTCVLCLGNIVYTSSERGVLPLLNWLDRGLLLSNFSAADQVVGCATAYLYCLLGVKEVFANIMSRPASKVLQEYGISFKCDRLVDNIINHSGTELCPFEEAVMGISSPEDALRVIRLTQKKTLSSNRKPIMQTGIQVSSLQPLLQNGAQVKDAFEKMARLGCHTVQLQWIDPSVTPREIAGILRETNITSVSVQDPFVTILNNLDYYTSLNAMTGGEWICAGRIPAVYQSMEGLDLYIAALRDLQKKLDPIGQRVCFHPLTADFRAVPGINAVEYLLDHMTELHICLDLYHLSRNCTDMPAFICKYCGRICMVHFKDAVGDTQVPAGQGDIDWTGVVKACLDTGIPYGFVEQEEWTDDPFGKLQAALEWLKQEISNNLTTEDKP